jgi:hypothetical protein
MSPDDAKYMVTHGIVIDDELINKFPGYELQLVDIGMKYNNRIIGTKCCILKNILSGKSLFDNIQIIDIIYSEDDIVDRASIRNILSNIVDISCLAANSSIETLNLSGCNKIVDISCLAANRYIKTLNLSRCMNLFDFSCLATNNTINTLDLTGCKNIVNISCLATIIRYNKLSDIIGYLN